jgi:hypothetical protein
LIKQGVCKVVASQSGGGFYLPANDVMSSINITGARALADMLDTLSGYQIKPIYVVPSDGVDHQLDQNGTISSILTEGNIFLRNQIGLGYQIDSTASGYDIEFFKTSMTTVKLETAVSSYSDLAQEMGLLNNPGNNRKEYIFFIDVPYLASGVACGYASQPGFLASVAVGDAGTLSGSSCTGPSLNVQNYSSLAWIHESIHSLGVGHTPDNPCDLMRGSGVCTTAWTVDTGRNHYVGSSVQGADISRQRVWSSNLTDASASARCFAPNSYLTWSDGRKFILCPTGTHSVGSFEHCWQRIDSAQLMVLQGGNWITISDGSSSQSPWGDAYGVGYCGSTDYPFSPSAQISSSSPGITTYRWVVNGQEESPFEVIWQN